MNVYAQMVVEAGKRSSGGLDDFRSDAAKALAMYFIYARNWPPASPSFQGEVREKWVEAMKQTLRAVIAQAWALPAKREDICQLAALTRLDEALYFHFSPWRECVQFHAATANELGMWQAWPQLHDVERLFPVSSAFQGTSTADAQAGQILNITQSAQAKLQTFQVNHASNLATAAWNNDYWNNR